MKTKIAIVITGLSFGGAERVTSYLANFFSEKGKEVYLISLTKGEHAYPVSPDVTIIELDESSSLNSVHRYAALICGVRKQIKSIKPDVVLGMMSFSGIIAALGCLGSKIPVILSERNDPNTSTAFSEREKKFIRFVYRHYIKNAVFQTEEARSYYFKDKESMGVIIPNPLYLDEMPEPDRKGSASRQIVSVGRLNNQKNYALLIESFVKVFSWNSSYSLTIYGEGEERAALEDLIKQHGLSGHVFLPGIEKDIFSKLQLAEMFVMSSNFEGMPNALIEAMAMGLPVISTDYSGGRGTLINNGKNGLLVPRMDANALAEAMIYFIEHPESSQSMGDEAVKIRKQLDSTIICDSWLRVIEKVV